MNSDKEYTWELSQVLDEMRRKYADAGLGDRWKQEESDVNSRLRGLCLHLCHRYTMPSACGVGGSGIVLKLIDTELSGQPVALKFPRPVPGQTELLSSLMEKEIAHLSALRHPSVVRIHSGSTIDHASGKFPFYIMDYLTGSKSGTHFATVDVDERSFIRMLAQVVDALRHMHKRGAAHLDIKPDNILIDSEGTPVIADLGTAKLVGSDPKDVHDTVVACTLGWADPQLVGYLDKDPSDPNRHKGKLARNRINLAWDLVPLGRVILHWLGYDLGGQQEPRRVALSPYARKYLLLMAARLLRGNIDQWLEDLVGVDRRVLGQLKYGSIDRVHEDMRKLTGEYSIVDYVPELNVYSPNTIQVSCDGPTTYTDRLDALVDHPSVQRLLSVTQLGVVSLLYTTSTHTRLEHALGTYHNACRFFLSLYYDPLSPLFRQLVDHLDAQAMLTAAVLHDIGQYPLAHDLEEFDRTMFSHTALGNASIRGIRDVHKAGASRIALPSMVDVLRQWETTPDRVIDILEAKPTDTDKPIKDRLLHSIIDGPIDADKLDYLRRDSDRLGLPYGRGIDVDRILRTLTVIMIRSGQGVIATIGVHEKGKAAAESVSVVRYKMYSQVYWQHTIRAIKAMLGRAMSALILELSGRGNRFRNQFRSEFEAFVLSLPGSLMRRVPPDEAPLLSGLGSGKEQVNNDEGEEFVTSIDLKGRLHASDGAVIAFLAGWLRRRNLIEAELLDDILDRRLYKRLFVFSPDRSGDQWRELVSSWDALTSEQRLRLYEHLERKIVDHIGAAATTATTMALGASQMDAIRKRAQAKKSLVLIDVPQSKSDGDVALHYVVEAQRRALRKDARAVGDVQPSAEWKRFSEELRERAGKVRVFTHASIVDAMEAGLSRDEFYRLFRDAVNHVT